MVDEARVACPATVWDGYRHYGLASGRVSILGCTIFVHPEDTSVLDARAVSGHGPELATLSVPAALAAAERYERRPICNTAIAGEGPVLAAKRPMALRELAGRQVALPGPQSTAALVCTTLLPSFNDTYMPSSAIYAAIERGDVEAGVLMHHDATACEEAGMVVLCDLNERFSCYQDGLSLPWSVACVRRDLDVKLKAMLEGALRESIAMSVTHHEEALAYGMEIAGVSSKDVAERLLASYFLADDGEVLTAFEQGIDALESYLEADYYAANGRF